MVTQQFHETLEPLSEWLGATEKHLINSEPIGTETSKLQDQITQHKVRSLIFCHGFFHFVHLFSFWFFFSLLPILFFHYISVYFLLCVCVFCFLPHAFGLLPVSVVRP